MPKLKDTAGEPTEPIEVVVFGEPYMIDVETHMLDNITYVLLARMDDLSTAIPRSNIELNPLNL